MSRAAVAAVVGLAAVLAGCGGGSGAASGPRVCPLLVELARTGQTVARADISDPNTFDATLQSAVTQYVATATKLRVAVPGHLQGDVERMIAAARRQRFADAVRARTNIDRYARAHCKTST
jgi:hypothetical protein